jgi:hypothetical protein
VRVLRPWRQRADLQMIDVSHHPALNHPGVSGGFDP